MNPLYLTKLSILSLFLSTSLYATNLNKYQVSKGQISFKAKTNTFLKVEGKSKSVKGEGVATVQGDKVIIKGLKLRVPPKSFKTGMSLRDKHLHEKVFQANGSYPDIVLECNELVATHAGAGTYSGSFVANVTMRGKTASAPFSVQLKRTGENSATVSANGNIDISRFGVPTITYTNITVDNLVEIAVDKLKFNMTSSSYN